MTNDNRISRRLLGTMFVGITLCLGLISCFESATFTDLGNGYQFGYYNGSKLTSNVFYNDQGIIPGVCSYAEWNDSFDFG